MFFGRRVGANVDVVGALCDLSAVDFVDDVINIFEVVGVGDDFVAGYDILWFEQSANERSYCGLSGRYDVLASGASCGEAADLVDNHGASYWVS